MTNRSCHEKPSFAWRAAIGAASIFGVVVTAAQAQPVYKDLERFGPPPYGRPGLPLVPPPVAFAADPDAGTGRPPRLVTGGPGYVGSDFGLGKPAFSGLGSRPDWGN